MNPTQGTDLVDAEDRERKKKEIIIGASILAGVAILAVATVLIYLFVKKKGDKKKTEERERKETEMRRLAELEAEEDTKAGDGRPQMRGDGVAL